MDQAAKKKLFDAARGVLAAGFSADAVSDVVDVVVFYARSERYGLRDLDGMYRVEVITAVRAVAGPRCDVDTAWLTLETLEKLL